MAYYASVIWTGDTTFNLNLDAESTTQSCFITTLYQAWHSNDGPIAASASLNNASSGYAYGVLATQAVSGAWGGVLNCIGRDASLYIEEVYLLFGTVAQTRQRAIDISREYSSTLSIPYLNNYIQGRSWTYVLGRQQATPLATPTGLNASNITSDSACVGWNAVTNAVDYKVEYRQTGGGGLLSKRNSAISLEGRAC